MNARCKYRKSLIFLGVMIATSCVPIPRVAGLFGGTSPVVENIPRQTILAAEGFTPINLDDYVADRDDSNRTLIWSSSGNRELQVEIEDRVARVTLPSADWTGIELINFRVRDPDGNWDSTITAFKVGGPFHEPREAGDWDLSSPEEQGLDPGLVNDLFHNAEALPNLYGLLIVKNGYLVAEEYFNSRDMDSYAERASVTKSYTSALTGIAIREGYIESIDQAMMDFFPELSPRIDDPRKKQITIRQILKMRSGYPWEEHTEYLDPLFSTRSWVPLLVKFPLMYDPGEAFGYSNLTAHLMGVIVARATGLSMRSFGEKYLFDPLGVDVDFWPQDAGGNNYGSGGIGFTTREMAKFGLLYLNEGVYRGEQLIPREWVGDSMQSYSFNMYGELLGSYFRDISYGYLWWAAEIGGHQFNFAWGHGGNLIILLHDLDMVIITTADHLGTEFGENAWEKERAVMDLVGAFIDAIPN